MTVDPDMNLKLIATTRRERFEELTAEVYAPLRRYLVRRAHPDSVDDVLAEVLLTVWRRLDDVPAENSLAWCYGVARRTLANQRRGESRRIRLLERIKSEPLYDSDAEGSDPVLEGALAQLSGEELNLIHLWAWEQLEPREIAIVLDSSPNAISLRLTRLKKKLATEIERQNQIASGHIPGNRAEET